MKTSSKDNFVLLNGQPVTEFLDRFCQVHPEVAQLHFAGYMPEPKLSERLRNVLSPEEQELRDLATTVCRGNGIPFYDALLGICMTRDAVPERFLESAGVHGSDPPAFNFDLSPAEVSTGKILGILGKLPEGCGLVVSSRVSLKNGDTLHIPMLDFRCQCSPGNAQAIRKILDLLGHKGGVLVESGRSYHFYGTTLLTTAAWLNFMARALLFGPVVDPRYVAHRIADGECRLKIAADKKSDIPKIVATYADSN